MEEVQEEIKNNKQEGKLIRCHPDLIEILEKLRKKVSQATYGVISDGASYYDLTGILAKKIGNK